MARGIVTISFARPRRRKLHNAYFALWAKVRLFRCISSQKRNHYAGLRFWKYNFPREKGVKGEHPLEIPP